MPRKARAPSSPQWPFWLLLAAWLCASTPQTATYIVLTWVSEARNFTHTERLTRDVAFLLGGEKEHRILDAAKEVPPAKPVPPMPAGLAAKKVDLSLERTCEVLPPALRAMPRFVSTPAPGGILRAAPPTEPPRGAAIA
jgi:hypothetical protein